MIKKAFAVASVTALTGLVSVISIAGCSSDDGRADPSTNDGGPDARPDRVPPPDAEPPPEPTTCAKTEPIDAAKFPYAKPRVTAGACKEEEYSALLDYFAAKRDAGESTSIDEWAKVVSESCSACVFSDSAAEAWSPIVLHEKGTATVNMGGCIGLASGKEACGAAYQQTLECIFAACADCASADERAACTADDAVANGPCKNAFTTLSSACGDSLRAAEKSCEGERFTFEVPIKIQCVTGNDSTADAGADGG